MSDKPLNDLPAKALIELVAYTDPYCTWCWGSEPVLRRIKEIYDEQVKIRYVMGGLVEDAQSFYDPHNAIGGAGMARQVAAHWEEASQRHKMPVDAGVFFDLEGEFKSTWPACIAYKAAEMQDVELAHRYLRRLREAAAAEHRFIHRLKVQAELAAEAGLDRERLLVDIESGKAEKAFQEDLRECRREGISGFPSYRLHSPDGGEANLDFYVSSIVFEEQLQRLAGGELKPAELVAGDKNILGFVEKYGKVAAREVGELFNMPFGIARERLDKLAEEGKITKQQAGNGWFYLKA